MQTVRTTLTAEEMQERFAERVKALYGLSVSEYLAARRAGTLERDIALEVFSGEAGGTGFHEEKGPHSSGGDGPLAGLHSEGHLMCGRRATIRRAISAGIRKLRFTGAF